MVIFLITIFVYQKINAGLNGVSTQIMGFFNATSSNNYSRTHLTSVDPRNLSPCDATWNIWRFGRGISQVSLAYDLI